MTAVIELSAIVIPENRQRQEFDGEGMVELMQSIRDRGLMHPPVLRSEGGSLLLVAGERRIRAIQQLWDLGGTLRMGTVEFPEGTIPFTNFGDLSPLEAEECELDENLKRRDLSWQEHSLAVARRHRLRDEQRKVRAEAAGEAHIPQTVAETSFEVRGRSDGSFMDATRKELIVAKYIDTNKAVASAKSVDEAFKILKAEETREQNIILAAQIGREYTMEAHTLINTDCISYMGDQSAMGRSFDVILTDPPYGMGADSFGDGGGKLTAIGHSYDDSPEAWHRLMAAWAPLSFAITKPQAHAYVFCDIDRFRTLRELMQNAGWYVFRTPFIVHKIGSGRVPLPDRGPRRSWEMLLYAIKGDKPVTHIYPDVIPCQGDEQLSGHGAQKPVALFQNLLQRSCRPGDTVLDTFAGTGPIFPAAHALKLFATGVETDTASYAVAMKRIQGLE